MESSETTVVSRVASGGPACTRLPSVTSARLTRPAMGDRTAVQPRLSRAVSTAASAARTAATLLATGAGPAVELLAGDGLHLYQLFGAAHLALGQVRRSARLLQLGLRPIEVGLVRAGIDLEEHLALADLAALGERHSPDVARDPGPDLDLVHRLEPAAELVPLGDVALEHRGHADGGAAAGARAAWRCSRRASHRAPGHRPERATGTACLPPCGRTAPGRGRPPLR